MLESMALLFINNLSYKFAFQKVRILKIIFNNDNHYIKGLGYPPPPPPPQRYFLLIIGDIKIQAGFCSK